MRMDLLKHLDKRTDELRQLYPDTDNDLLCWFACRSLDFEVRMQDPGYLRRLHEQERAKVKPRRGVLATVWYWLS